jgi:hypothetical protein
MYSGGEPSFDNHIDSLYLNYFINKYKLLYYFDYQIIKMEN